MSDSRAKTPLKIFVIVAVVAALTMACAIWLGPALDVLQQKTERADVSEINDAALRDAPYYVDVKVKLATVNLDEETVRLQLECIPTGDDLFVGGASGSPTQVSQIRYPITLALGISEAGTQRAEVFSGANTGGIIDVDLDLEGNVQQYPSDRHTAKLWLQAYRTAPGLDPDPMPVRLTAHGAWPGLNITLRPPQLKMTRHGSRRGSWTSPLPARTPRTSSCTSPSC